MIGDFRDHQGCATYDELGVRLCFNILPDVSNVGVNARELTLTIDSFDDVRFTGASNADGVLKIGFSASAQGAPKSIELTLRQI
ncbi:MAG: hypothetical protein HY075_06090 [Deltaproteobacteria bacterium]|nr:hypothetical protein [Deltaproteobacteria bacterium]